MATPIHDRVVVISGASSGIGEQMARQLLDAGNRVAAMARREDRLAGLVEDYGDLCLPLVQDVTDEAGVHQQMQEVIDKFGHVDLVIANAGSSRGRRAHKGPVDTAKTIRTNLLGTAFLLEAAIPHMVERRSGHLVGVSSFTSVRGMPRVAAYSGSKAGIENYLESLRVDLRKWGVTVSTIIPGFVKTDLVSRVRIKMPFIMSAEKAAGKILRAVGKRRRVYAFPWRMKIVAGVIQRTPNWLYDRVASRGSGPKD